MTSRTCTSITAGVVLTLIGFAWLIAGLRSEGARPKQRRLISSGNSEQASNRHPQAIDHGTAVANIASMKTVPFTEGYGRLRVVDDATDRPIAGATVRAIDDKYSTRARIVPVNSDAIFITNEYGQVSVISEDKAPLVHIDKPRFVPRLARASRHRVTEIRMRRGATLTVQVKNAIDDEIPLSPTMLRLSRTPIGADASDTMPDDATLPHPGVAGVHRAVVTDDNPAVFTGLVAGEYELRCINKTAVFASGEWKRLTVASDTNVVLLARKYRVVAIRFQDSRQVIKNWGQLSLEGSRDLAAEAEFRGALMAASSLAWENARADYAVAGIPKHAHDELHLEMFVETWDGARKEYRNRLTSPGASDLLQIVTVVAPETEPDLHSGSVRVIARDSNDKAIADLKCEVSNASATYSKTAISGGDFVRLPCGNYVVGPKDYRYKQVVPSMAIEVVAGGKATIELLSHHRSKWVDVRSKFWPDVPLRGGRFEIHGSMSLVFRSNMPDKLLLMPGSYRASWNMFGFGAGESAFYVSSQGNDNVVELPIGAIE